MNLLSERVGSDGVVVGIEREPRFAAMIRAELSERGLRNVHVVNGDAKRTELEKSSYDIVHEWLILIICHRPLVNAIEWEYQGICL
jgi:protein-L-isoaspartate O-methyltransferase